MADKHQYAHAEEAANFIRSKFEVNAEIGVILGNGLTEFANELTDHKEIPYSQIPHFKATQKAEHEGKLIYGKVGGKPILCLLDRIHFFEGHKMQDVVFPVRVLKLLGVQKLVLTNSAGGISKLLVAGDLMIIRDQINYMGTNPLIGHNDDRFGPRFPDQSEIYSRELQDLVAKHMKKLGIAIKRGIFIALTGPSYEAPAEIEMAKIFGADAVAMSTAPEAIVANHMGMKIVGISCVTNMASGLAEFKMSHEEVCQNTDLAKVEFKTLLSSFIPEL